MKDPIITAQELRAMLNGSEPAPIDWHPVTEEKKKELLAAVDAHVRAIRQAPSVDPASISGTCFYVSADGDDDADGRSPASAWRTTGRLHRAQDDGTVQAGDGVFFRRGDVWDAQFPGGFNGDMFGGEYALRLKCGVTYSAYGEGPKPLFRNCLDASDPSCWEETEYPGVWAYKGDAGDRTNDIGDIIIDEGAVYPIKVIPGEPNRPYDPDRLTPDCGMVTTKRETFFSGKVHLTCPGDIAHDLQFLHDYDARRLYLRWSAGNPGDSFGTILLARRGNIIRSDWESKDILVDNLAACYGGSHGLSVTNAQNVEIRNCEFRWIGGSFQERIDNFAIRYGNAVENWGPCDGYRIHDCLAEECYDTAFTTQYETYDGDPVRMRDMRNVEFCDNVIRRVNYVFEIFYPTGWKVDGLRLTGNDCLYAGYHFGHQRPDKNGDVGCLGGRHEKQDFRNAVLRGNRMLFIACYALYTRGLKTADTEEGIAADGNVYLLGADRAYMRSCAVLKERSGEGRLYPYDRETLSALAAMGVDAHSTFYYHTGRLYPEEEQGVYLIR